MTNEALNRVERADKEVGPGSVLGGRYELLTQIARGGMGYVWAARSKGGRGFRRIVAVKTMVANDYEETRLEEMLFQEARFASMIQHPNVVAVEDFGEHEGVCYLVMELVRGETLLKLFKASEPEGGLPLKIAVNLVGQVCRGLQAAHDLTGEDGQPLGLVHRDVTPGNIIVSYGGVAKLSDFGIAKAATGVALTQNGELKGKMSYMAPEQLMQRPSDRRVDIFAIGVTLYMATTGVHPFRNLAGGMGDVLSRILSEKPPPSPTDIVDSYPKGLEKVVMKALAKKSDERHSTAKELLDELVEAMPEAFEAGIEKEIQEYLQGLLSERISETTASIRAAEEMAEKSFSSVRAKPQEEAEEEPRETTAHVAKTLLLVFATILIPFVILAAVAMKLRKPEVVERTRTVYLPGETKTVTVTAPGAVAAGAPSAAAPAKAVAGPPAPPGPRRASAPGRRTEEEGAQAEKPSEEEARTQSPAEPTPTVATSEPAAQAPAPAPTPQASAARAAAPAGPKLVSSSEGQRRLLINPSTAQYRPLIPKTLENLGPFTADVRMCVGTTGEPESITIGNVNPALGTAFRRALSRWRFRPMSDGTTSTGFCYSFRYEVQ